MGIGRLNTCPICETEMQPVFAVLGAYRCENCSHHTIDDSVAHELDALEADTNVTIRLWDEVVKRSTKARS